MEILFGGLGFHGFSTHSCKLTLGIKIVILGSIQSYTPNSIQSYTPNFYKFILQSEFPKPVSPK